LTNFIEFSKHSGIVNTKFNTGVRLLGCELNRDGLQNVCSNNILFCYSNVWACGTCGWVDSCMERYGGKTLRKQTTWKT